MLEPMTPEAENITDEFLSRMKNFLSKDREAFLERFKNLYCIECGGVLATSVCNCTRDE